MYGDEEPDVTREQQQEINQRLALIRQEAKAIADTNEVIHAKVPAINDAPAQVRIAVYGLEIPPPGSSPKEKIRFCQHLVSRIPSLSQNESWELRRTLADIVDIASCGGRSDVVHERIDLFIFRLEALISTADPKATQGLTGISALITSDRRETVNQTVRQLPLAQNSPGLVDGLRNLISGRQ
jgi:hypothetical protein